MAENTIDTLALEVSSNAASASKGLDRLTASLMGIDKATKRGVSGLSSFSSNISSFASSINGINFSGLSSMSKGLNDFASVAQNISKVKVGDIGKTITRIKKLESLKNVDLSGISASLQPLQNTDFSGIVNLGNALQSLVSNLAGAEKVSAGTSRIVTSVSQLAASAGNIPTATSALPGLSSEIRSFIDTVAQAPQIDAGTASLVSSLSGIASSGVRAQKAASALPDITKGVSEFISALSKAPKLNNNVVNAVKSLAQLSSVGGKAGAASRSLSGNVTKLSSSMGGLFSNISRAVGGLSSFGSSAQKAKKRTSGLASSIAKLYAAYFSVTRGVKALWGSVESASNYIETLNYFNASFGQVASVADVSSWEELGYKSAEAYANSFEERAKELTKKLTGFQVSESGDLTRTSFASLGLDPDKTMQYQATFAQMASSMGATADVSVKLSNALTMIGADLASVRNMEFEDVWQDMASGMVGMSRTLDKYGVNIRNVNLQQELYNLGIDKTISSLNQEEKAILRTVILLNSTRYAWGDLANTINQPANQLRLLRANFTALSRTIGSLFLPIVAKVLPFINALVIAIQRLFAWLGKLLGVKLSNFSSSIGGSAVDMGELSDESEGAAGNIDDAADSAKKLEKTLSLLPFDQLNQLSKQPVLDSGTGGNGSGANVGGGLDDMSALEGALDAALAEYQKAWDDAFSKMENDANDMADKIVDVFKKIAETAEPTTDAIKKLWNEGLKKLGDFSWDTIKDFWNNFLIPMGKWMLSDNSGLPRFFNITNDLLNEINWGKLNGYLDKFFTSLQKPAQFAWDSLMDFYEYFLKPLSVWTMSEAVPQLVDALTKFNKNIDWKNLNDALTNFWNAMAPFAKSVGQGLVNFFRDMLSIGEGFLNTTLPDGLNSIAEKIKNISPETAEKVGEGLGKVALALLGFKLIGSVAKTINMLFGEKSALMVGLNILKGIPYLTTVAGLFGIAGALDYFGVIKVDWDFLKEKLGDIKDILVEFVEKINWESIKDGLGKLWSSFQPFVEGFADGLIDALNVLVNDIGAPLINGIGSALGLLGDLLLKIDPEVAESVGYGISTLVSAFVGFKTMQKVGTTISAIGSSAKSLLEGLAGHPYLIIAAGLSAVAAGLYNLSENGFLADEDTKKAIDNFDSISQKIQETKDSIRDFLDETEGKNRDIDATYQVIRGMADEYLSLKEKVRLTAEEQKKLSDLESTLSTELPGFQEIIENTTGKYDDQKTAIYNLIQQTEGYYKTLAAQEYIQQYYDKMFDLEVAIQANRDAFNELADAQQRPSWAVGPLYAVWDSFDSGSASIRKCNDEYLDLKEQQDGLQEELSAAESVLQKYGIAIDGVSGSYTGMASDAQEAATATEGVGKKTGNSVIDMLKFIGQATLMELGLGGIKTEGDNAEGSLSTLGTTISNFVKDLATNAQTALDKGKETGKNYPSGMAKGIEENETLVTTAGKNLVDDLNETVENEADINSPSGVAKGYGQQYDQGLANGIAGYAYKVTDAISLIVRDINKSFSISKTMYSKGQSIIQSFVNGMQSVHIPAPYLEFTTSTVINGNSATTSTHSFSGWRANGGFFDRPTIIGVGEAGREIALPLDNKRVMRTVSNSIMENASHQFVDTGAIANAVEKAVVNAMMRNSGNQSSPQYIMNNIELDGEVMARAVTKAQKKIDYRMNPTPQF